VKRVNCSISAATREICGCSALAETGDVQALPNRPPGNNHKITNWEQFRAFAKTHGDKTQVEMAQLWQGEISDRTISRALKKIGFTRKKRPTATKNGMR
jgi:transposase